MKTISPRDLYEQLQHRGHVPLIDVRTPVEFRSVHATPAKNVPLDQLSVDKATALVGEARPVYVICKSGSRGSKACEQLAASGLDVVNVDGGTEAWAAAGLPVVRGKASMSLERQVRIAAGLLVLVGVTLAYLIHPAWMGLSAFVGAGLVFAGITDTCGMGLMLAKMPWNQVRGQAHGGSGPACDSSARSSSGSCCG